jgi:hypothetical protein
MNALKKKIEKKELNRQIFRISQELEENLRSRVKEKDRQINMAKLTNLIKALVITVKIRGTRARILIDFGYLGNFVFPDFVKKAQFYTQTKKY